MKKIITILKIAGFALCIALLMTGCFMEPSLSKKDAGTGTVELIIAGSEGRTLLPVWNDVDYNVSYGPATGGSQTTVDSLIIELNSGTYNFTVSAIKDESVIGIGIVNGVEVKPNESISVEVYLTPEGTEPGTLSWILDYPDITGVTAILEYNDGAGWKNLVVDTGNTEALGSKDFPPGSYTVRSELTGPGGSAGDIEAFHIYSNMTTNLHWQYSADTLLTSKNIAGSVIISATASINGVTLTLTGDGGMSNKNITLTENAGTWEFETSVPDNVTTLGGTLHILSENNGTAGLDHSFSGIAYAADISIPAVSIYTLTASIGANGTLKVNDDPISNGGKLDFVNNTVLTFTANGDVGYVVDTLSPASPFTINTDTTVSVTFKTGANPNMIWAWQNATQQWTSLATGGTNIFYADNYPDIGCRAYGAAIGNDNNNGMRIGGAAYSGGQRLAIGYTVTDATTSTVAAIAGQFDFTKKVKVTINYENVVQFGSRVVLRVSVNNNTNGAANANLSNASQIANYNAAQLQAAALPGATATAGTVEVIIDPEDFTIAQQALLSTAFLGIHTQHDGDASGTGNWLTISGISIEYMEATTGGGDIIINNPDNPPVNFGNFPPSDFDLDVIKTYTLGSGYTEAAWFINSINADAGWLTDEGLTITLDPAEFIIGKTYTLSAVLNYNGQWYSKSAKFTVK